MLCSTEWSTDATTHKGLHILVGLPGYRVVLSESDFDEYVAELSPLLLEYATAQTRRFLRETGQWESDVAHDKLAQRWGYELLERFQIWGRREVPCRPVQLFDCFLFRHYSQPECLGILEGAASPVSRFLDALLSRAVCSRDAMVASFYHLYGMGQQQVARILALGSVESQRVYKNYMRWRSTGWLRMVQEVGFTEAELREILEQKRRNPARLQRQVEQLVQLFQPHYRKSEPALYPCLSRARWRELYAQDCGQDYRGWHLPFCQSCLTEVWDLRELASEGEAEPKLDLHIHPLAKAAAIGF